MKNKSLTPRQFNELRVTLVRSVPVVDSREVAQMIGRPHWQLLRTIDTMVNHLTDNKIVVCEYFISATYRGENGKELPRFDCTRKGCDMVANKQTGERGTIFTAAYATRFYEMDELLREKQTDTWQQTRKLTKQTRKAETDVIKQFVEYARSHMSSNAEHYYSSLSELANRSTGINNRDFSDTEKLHRLHIVERVISTALASGMRAGKEYHAIYRDAKQAVEQFVALVGLQEGA